MTPREAPVEDGWAARGAVALLGAGVLACVLLVWPLPPLEPLDFLQAKSAVWLAAASLASACWLVGRRACALDGAAAALALAVVLGLVATLTVAENRSLAWSSWGLSTGAALGFGVTRALPERARGRLLLVVLAAVLVAAGVAILEAFRLTPHLSTAHRVPGGTLGNRNHLSHLLVLTLPSIALLGVTGRRWVRALALLGALSAGYLIVLARSRGAWLGAALVIALWTALVASRLRHGAPRSTGRRATALVLALLLGAAAAVALPNRLRWRSAHPYRETLSSLVDSRSGSGRGRMIQYRTSLALASESLLLGVGPGNWSVQYPRVAAPGDPSVNASGLEPVNRVPSSDALAILCERGVIVLVLLLAVAVQLLARARRALWRRTSLDEALALGAGGVTLLALGWLGVIDAVLVTPAAACVASVVLGALVPRPTAPPHPIAAQAGDAASAVASAPCRAACVARTCAAVALAVLGLLGASREAALLVVRHQARTAARPEDVEARVVRYAGADYPARMTLAMRWAFAGECDKAATHLDAAARLLPAATAPARLAASCAARRPRAATGSRQAEPSRSPRSADRRGEPPRAPR
ncbi:MAG: O-antigen ligase family protein [Kofleriaceae bacterium]